MPTGTWERLPDDKRRTITAVAEAEFAARGFSGASLNTISRQAGVSKGSLFQYFTDKADLWRFIVDRASERTAAHMLDAMQMRDPSDSASMIDHLAEQWIGYFFDHPLDRALAAAATMDPDPLASSTVTTAALPYFRTVITEALSGAEPERFRCGRPVDVDGIVAVLMTLLPSLALAAHRHIGDDLLGPAPVPREQAVRHAQRLIGIVTGTR